MYNKIVDWFKKKYRLRPQIEDGSNKWILEQKRMFFGWEKLCLYDEDNDRLYWSVFADYNEVMQYCPRDILRKMMITDFV